MQNFHLISLYSHEKNVGKTLQTKENIIRKFSTATVLYKKYLNLFAMVVACSISTRLSLEHVRNQKCSTNALFTFATQPSNYKLFQNCLQNCKNAGVVERHRVIERYLRTFWLTRMGVELFFVYGLPHRTTNSIEVYNQVLLLRMNVAHGSIWSFINKFHNYSKQFFSLYEIFLFYMQNFSNIVFCLN